VVLRTLLRSPAFTACTILTIALGSGANTGAFSALNALLLKRLPYPEPQRLVSLYETTLDRKPRGVAEGNLLDWQRRSTLFESMAAYQPRSFGLTLSEQDPVTVIQTGMVMAAFFPAIGVPPAIGRTFSEQEEIAEAHTIVLSDRLWRELFAADPGVIGRKVWINEAPYTVIGVMPAGFEYPMDNGMREAFLPLSRRDYCCARIGSQAAIARLKPGVTLTAARAELESIASALAAEYPATNRGRSAGLLPLEEAMHGARREPLTLLLAAAGLLLAIACANVAGLMLAWTFTRSREIAIRAALGASLWQLARQFLAEAAVLCTAGAAAGLLAAKLVLRAAPSFLPGPADPTPLHLDAAAFLLAAASALALTLILGFVPLLKAAPILAFRRGWAGNRMRSVLVMAQVALSVALLLGAGLLLRSFFRLLAVHPGFETAHALRFGIGLPEARYDTGEKLIAFHHQLLARLAAIPGIEHAGATSRLPLRGSTAGPGSSFQLAGANIPIGQRPRAWITVVSPGYFAAMGIPLLQGRDFSWRDDQPHLHKVAIVNHAFAETYLRDRRAPGTLLDLRWLSDLNPANALWEVVGIAGDTRQSNLDRDPVPEIFLSMSQTGADGASYIVRTRTGDPGLPKAISAATAALDPRIERIAPVPLRLVVERSLESRTATIQLVGAFGGLALLLTAVGVYGIAAFRAAERSREMAIRVALGATPRQVRLLLLEHAVRLAAAGTAVGLACYLRFGKFLAKQLYGVSPADPLTLALVSATVIAVALLAASAVRTTHVDLMRE
jgi:putative ABC transport system permease protein